MNAYKYSAKDKKGFSVNGIIQAASEAEVTDILHKKEMVVFSVEFIKISTANLKLIDKKVKLDV